MLFVDKRYPLRRQEQSAEKIIPKLLAQKDEEKRAKSRNPGANPVHVRFA